MDEGVSGGKHFELVGNDDIMIETTFRADDQRIYHKGYDQDEVHFQLSGRRATRTSQGEYMLETGDMLVIPPASPIATSAVCRLSAWCSTPRSRSR